MDKSQIIKDHFSKLGSKGGKAKASKRTPEQRKEDMRKVWEASRIARLQRKRTQTCILSGNDYLSIPM